MPNGISTYHTNRSMLDHANRYADLWEAHLRTALLDALPRAQRELDVKDNPFEPPMGAFTRYLDFPTYKEADIRGSWVVLVIVTMPDHMRAVFVHALDECPPVILPEYATLPLSGLPIPTPRPFFLLFFSRC